MSLGPGGGPIRYVALPVTGVWSTPGGVLVAAPAESVAFGPEQLLQAMLVIGPIILAGSVGLGYVLADTSLRPVEGMMDELKAISDGRSLHRRLALPQADELAHLAVTMNGMLARLEQSFASLRRFTADASHELKTPLMVLRVGVERALTHAGTPPEALEALDETLEQINRMTEMVDSLLTLARADEGSATLAVAPTDLRQLVEEASETANILGEAPGIAVRTELPETPVMLAVDQSRIRQLLLNLVTNAIKYTPPGGRISLGLVDRGESVALVVGDNGIGIAPGDLPHIFDRFWRADVARNRSGDRPGTGLGLAITKWVAEAHGGTINAQSRPGRGTVFTVTLPRAGGVATGEPAIPDTDQEEDEQLVS
jgi:signal transduction histidine kinase